MLISIFYFTELPSPKRFEYNAHLMSSIKLSTFPINHMSCFEPNRMWLSAYNRIMEINEDGHLLRELSVCRWTHAGCHTLTKAGDLLFVEDSYICMLSSSGEIRNLHIHANTLSCIHSSRLNGNILVIQGKWIVRYNDKGVELQQIELFRDIIMTYHTCDITENINGDIVVASQKKRKVVAVRGDGQHKFTYLGLYPRSKFVPSGICNDIFGHLLVGNSCFDDPCVHLLDENGELLAKLLTHQGLEVNALCVDDRNNLYVGCKNRINVYTYLPDTTITKHDTKVIDIDINESPM